MCGTTCEPTIGIKEPGTFRAQSTSVLPYREIGSARNVEVKISKIFQKGFTLLLCIVKECKSALFSELPNLSENDCN